MTPTPAWYEADSDDSDRNVTVDITASTPQEPHGAILPAVEPARGFSDADLLRRRTAALNRTSAENERLRAEVERMRAQRDELDDLIDEINAERADADSLGEALAREVARAEAAEAKLRDVEALADVGDGWHTFTEFNDYGLTTRTRVRSVTLSRLRAVLARSQAPADDEAQP